MAGNVSITLTRAIGEIDAKIRWVNSRAAEEVAGLEKRKAVLESTMRLITPELEQAYEALMRIGVVTSGNL